VLDAYQCYPDNLYYHQIINKFKLESLAQILGFKFQGYAEKINCNLSCPLAELSKTLNEKVITPYPLFTITANLIKAELISIKDIWVHLSPADTDINEWAQKKYNTALSVFKRNYEKKLNATDEQKKKDKETEITSIEEVESQLICKNINISLIPSDNQKLWLMEALVKNNSWILFEKLYGSLNSCFDLNSHLPLLNTILNYLEWLIEPVYRPISPTRFTKKPVTLVNFPIHNSNLELQQIHQLDLEGITKIARVCKIVGPAIGKNVLVYTKLCRLFRHYLDHPSTENHNAIYEVLVYICTQILLPAISLVKSNPGVIANLWNIIQDFDFSIRIQAYEEWFTFFIYSNSTLLLEGFNTIKQATPWFKTVTADTVKQKGRILGNLSHNNPGLVFKLANQIIKNYSNLIEPIVNALSYCSNLSMDVIIFLTLRDLSNAPYEDKAKTQLVQEGTIHDIHANFATFLGHFLRKYYTVDLTSIFSFLMNRLFQNQYLDLVILKEIISKMSGSESIEVLNQNQLQALAGGINLQIEAASIANDFKK